MSDKTSIYHICKDGTFEIEVSDGYKLTIPFEMVESMKESMDHLEYHVINNIGDNDICNFYKNKDKEHEKFN